MIDGIKVIKKTIVNDKKLEKFLFFKSGVYCQIKGKMQTGSANAVA